MKPEFKIYRIQNGFLLEYEEYIDDDRAQQKYKGYTVPDTIYNEDDERKQECENYQQLAHDLLELLGYFHSKHKKYNLRIEVDDQDSEEE